MTAILADPRTELDLAERDVRRTVYRLRQRRIALGLTQRQVAARLGTQQSSVSDWETGLTIPTAASLARLARLYGLRLTLAEVMGP